MIVKVTSKKQKPIGTYGSWGKWFIKDIYEDIPCLRRICYDPPTNLWVFIGNNNAKVLIKDEDLYMMVSKQDLIHLIERGIK